METKQTFIFDDEGRKMLETGGGFQSDDDTARLGLEQQCVMSWSTVSVSRSTDDQWSDRVLAAVPDAADLVTGARATGLDDSLHLGVRLGRRPRAAAVTAERLERQLDSLSGLGSDPPAAIRLRRHPDLTADVSSFNWHCHVPSLATLCY